MKVISWNEAPISNMVANKVVPKLPSKRDALSGLLSSKMNKMTMEERTEGLHDLHGVADLQEETSEMIKQNIQEMTRALNMKCLKSDDTRAYEKAVALSRPYVESLKLPFLRAQSYKSQDAADHMIRFFTRKMELFGEDLLINDIELQDMEDEAVTALKRGLFQLAPQRDQSGRAIFFIDGKENNESISTPNFMRAMYYMAMVAMRDEETQKKGIVVVSYANYQTSFVPGRSTENIKSWAAHPIRVVALHLCIDWQEIHPTLCNLCNLMEDKNACRFRLHNGSYMESMFKLMTFGIPREAIPVDFDGSVDLTPHAKMMRELESKEAERRQRKVASPDNEASLSNIVQEPGPLDILLGRGRLPKSSEGAWRMRRLLVKNWGAYEAAKKTAKTRLAEKILCQLKESGCRFRKVVPSGYEECNDAVAREKISHAFRNLRLLKGDTPIAPSNVRRKGCLQPVPVVSV